MVDCVLFRQTWNKTRNTRNNYTTRQEAGPNPLTRNRGDMAAELLDGSRHVNLVGGSWVKVGFLS